MNGKTITAEGTKLEVKPIEIKKRKKPSEYPEIPSLQPAELEDGS